MLIVLNNKCNLTKEEFITYQNELNNIESRNPLVLCPSDVFLSLFSSNKVELGSQNVSKTNMGAYTGEVSANQLKTLNVKYSIVGHSERRKYQKETPTDINEKIKRLLENDITPIYCIGESKEERENKEYKDILKNDILKSLADIKDEDKNKIIIAYEPIWSIGTGIVPKNYEIEEVVNLITGFLPNNKILYGGSVNENNIDTLKSIQGIDGYLLGGVSLQPDKLSILIEKLMKK